MKRTKKWASMFLAATMALTLTACGGGDTSSTDSGGEADTGSDTSGTAEYTIKVGHTLQENTPAHQAWLIFEEQVETNSGGRISVELYPNSSLGSERVMFEACQMGTLEVAYGTTSVLANFDPNLKVLDLPFLFADEATAREAITGELGAAAAADLEKAQEDIDSLKAELMEVTAEPAPVAVETVVDEEAVKAAAEEAAEKLKAKIEKAEKAKERAEQAKAKAEQDLAAMKVAQEEAQAIANQEKKNLAEQVQALQKKLAVASSSEMTIFKLHFEQGQTSINKMTECIEKMMEAGDGEGAGKLRNALAALLTTTLEVLK